MSEEVLKAEALVRLSQSPDGQVFLREVQEEFDKAMKQLLFDSKTDLKTLQGRCQGFHVTLEMFVKAQDVMKGNTHGAS